MSRVFRTQSHPRRALSPVSRLKTGDKAASLPDPATLVSRAKEEAESILAQAKQEAAALLDEARAQRDSLVAEAREAGREEGRRDGHAAGLLEAESLIKEAADALSAARGAYAEMLKESEPKLLALAVEVSRRVVTDSFSADQSLALELIRKGLGALKDEREFSLRVDPALVTLIEGEKDALSREFGARSIEVIGDPDICGGAVIMTPHGYVDVTVESQIRNISTALAEARKKAMGLEPQ